MLKIIIFVADDLECHIIYKVGKQRLGIMYTLQRIYIFFIYWELRINNTSRNALANANRMNEKNSKLIVKDAVHHIIIFKLY